MFAVVAHRAIDKFEYTYATNLGNPLDERQRLPGRANVIQDYKDPPIDDRIAPDVQMPCELHVDLFRLLAHRYTYPKNLVIGMPMGTGNVAVGALFEQRRFVGFDTNPAYVKEAIGRCYVKYTKNQGTFGINTAVMPTDDRLPATMVASDHAPPAFRDVSGTDSLADAKRDAQVYSLELKKSKIPGAGMGLFAKKGFKEGELLGYYWGRFFFNREDAPDSNRVIATQKKRVSPSGQLENMYIDGSLRCAVTYINDPKGTEFVANATFTEESFDTRRVAEGELTSPPLWTIMRAVAKIEIPIGSEILANYANDYFVINEGSSYGSSSPAAEVPPLSPQAVATEESVEVSAEDPGCLQDASIISPAPSAGDSLCQFPPQADVSGSTGTLADLPPDVPMAGRE
jgi:hypothetical protein